MARKFNKILTTAFCFMTAINICSQTVRQTPKLVVTIVVDQLRSDYLQYFSPTFGDKGFKRLMNNGLVYHNLDFGLTTLDNASSAATVFTGAYPRTNGITGNKRYDFEAFRETSILYDYDYIGNYTSDRYSPLALLCSTITDELKIASSGYSDVYAIAPDAEEAIISAGKYADAAFWLDNYSGHWATTTYYKNIPWYIDRYNTTQSFDTKIDTWTPALSSYNAFPYSRSFSSFRHNFPKGDKDRFLKIKQTPLINSEVTRLAERFFEYADFGKRGNPDFLAITYHAGEYTYDSSMGSFNWEIQDTYYRLDKEIEQLLDLVDRKVGLQNTLIVLSGSGYYDAYSKLPEGYQPSGEFYPTRCLALLNMYLAAIYGSGEWTKGFYANQVYLNHKLIEEKSLDRLEIIRKSADFLVRLSGVQEVVASEQWLFGDSRQNERFRRAMHKNTSGDLFLKLQPGWKLVTENKLVTKNNQTTERYTRTITTSPIIFFGANIHHSNVFRKVNATEIAPTLAFLLRIKKPNAAEDSILEEFFSD